MPEIKPEPGDWRTLTIGGGSGPTEDWGDWTDPRALIAHALRLAIAVAADPAAPTAGMFRTLNSVHRLEATVSAVEMS